MAVVGLLALGLMTVSWCGEIDISLPAILALGNILLAARQRAACRSGSPFRSCVLAGALAGLVNGVLVVAFGLPSLAVTLGAIGAYRALALLLGGQEGYADFPDSYIWLGSAMLGCAAAVAAAAGRGAAGVAFVMHVTVFGRQLYMVGSNARRDDVLGRTGRRVKVAAFAIAGAISGLAAFVYIGQFQSARADNASDMLLFVVTAVVLGGVDIFGGRGNVAGVAAVAAAAGHAEERHGPGEPAGPVQTLVIGTLLMVSIAIPQCPACGGAGPVQCPARFRRHALQAEPYDSGAREELR